MQFNFNILLQNKIKGMKLFRQIKVGSKHQSSRFALITEHIEETANMTVKPMYNRYLTNNDETFTKYF